MSTELDIFIVSGTYIVHMGWSYVTVLNIIREWLRMTTYTYNSQNCLTYTLSTSGEMISYSYDGNGNLLSKTAVDAYGVVGLYFAMYQVDDYMSLLEKEEVSDREAYQLGLSSELLPKLEYRLNQNGFTISDMDRMDREQRIAEICFSVGMTMAPRPSGSNNGTGYLPKGPYDPDFILINGKSYKPTTDPFGYLGTGVWNPIKVEGAGNVKWTGKDFNSIAKNANPNELINSLENSGWTKTVEAGGGKSGPATILTDPVTGTKVRIHATPGEGTPYFRVQNKGGGYLDNNGSFPSNATNKNLEI